ncbi:Dchs1, partial [Symbiodinium sp. KB8]
MGLDGKLTVNDGSRLRLSTKAEHVLTVLAVGPEAYPAHSVAIAVVHVLDSPDAPDLSEACAQKYKVSEAAVPGTVIARLLVDDEDEGDVHTFATADADEEGAVTLSADGILTVGPRPASFEARTKVSLPVTVTDDAGLTDSCKLTIHVGDANDAPVVQSSKFSVSEAAAPGTVVGFIAFIDEDVMDQHTFSLLSASCWSQQSIGVRSGGLLPQPVRVATTTSATALLQIGTSLRLAADEAVLSVHLKESELTVKVCKEASCVERSTESDEGETRIVIDTLVNEVQVSQGKAKMSIALELEQVPATFRATVSSTIPGASLKYFCVQASEDSDGTFVVDRSTGAIVVGPAGLSYATQVAHGLKVQVHDDGAPEALAGEGIVHVHVKDSNNAPVFSNPVVPCCPALYVACVDVAETASAGTVVARGTEWGLADADEDQEHTFSLELLEVPTHLAGTFGVERLSGDLSLSKAALRDFKVPAVVAELTATDNGVPSAKARGQVLIRIKNVHEAPSVKGVRVSVPENQRSGTVLPDSGIDAMDVDGGAFGRLWYRLAAPNSFFSVDEHTGNLKLRADASLDASRAREHLVHVEALTGPSGGDTRSSRATVTVAVEDINDAPMFVGLHEDGTLHRRVPEDAAGGARVGAVLAVEDADADQVHTFAILGGAGETFTLNPHTGQLLLAEGAKLDAESTPVHELTVRVTDNGVNPAPRSATVTVKVLVQDVNEAPFIADALFAVPEDVAPGAQFGAPLQARDPDAGDSISLRISKGDPTGSFAIDGDGYLVSTAAGVLDFESSSQSSYDLVVSATDRMGHVATSHVSIVALDVNEAPSCEDAVLTISEDASETSVGGPFGSRLPASDVDAGANGKLKFSTLGGGAGLFDVDPTGQVLLTPRGAMTGALDHERVPEYTLSYLVEDGGGLRAECEVVIQVEDANEAPTFASVTPKVLVVQENTPPGTAFGPPLLSFIRDSDEGQTHTMHIAKSSHPALFAVERSTGQLFVRGALNHEAVSTVSLTLVAVDSGSPAATSVPLVVSVHIQDLAEPPTLRPATLVLLENSKVGAPLVGSLGAHDDDGAASDSLTYSVETSSHVGRFAVDARSGTVFLTEDVDVDFEASHEDMWVSIRALDSTALAAVARYTVVVGDVDESPALLSKLAQFSVPEGAAAGSVVGTLAAWDADGDAASAVFEGTAFVSAKEGGRPTDSCKIRITTVASESAAPRLSAVPLMAVVSEGAAPMETVLSVSSDLPVSEYRIVQGDTGGVFDVSSDGRVVLNRAVLLDRELQETYDLVVEATSPEGIAGRVAVAVSVQDVNDVAPVLSKTSLKFAVSESATPGSVLFRLEAIDPDLEEEVTFALGGSARTPFSVKADGQVALRSDVRLDFESAPTLFLPVQLTDKAGTRVDAMVTVVVLDENETPVLDNVVVSISEGTPVGTLLATELRAVDNDVGDVVTFSVVSDDLCWGPETTGTASLSPVPVRATTGGTPEHLRLRAGAVSDLMVLLDGTQDGTPIQI